MALRVNGQLVGGVNTIPSYTQEQYDALSVKPEFWICIDKDYLNVPSENVSYNDSNVKDTLDDVTEQIANNKWVDITDEITWNSAITSKKALYNESLKLIKIKFYCAGDDGLANAQTYVTLPSKYTIDTTKHVSQSGYYMAFGQVVARWQATATATTYIFSTNALIHSSNLRSIVINYPVNATAYKHICDVELFIV